MVHLHPSGPTQARNRPIKAMTRPARLPPGSQCGATGTTRPPDPGLPPSVDRVIDVGLGFTQSGGGFALLDAVRMSLSDNQRRKARSWRWTHSWRTSACTPSVDGAKADYEAVHDLHTKEGLIDAYDAAVIERKENGKVKIVKKHETPTRVGRGRRWNRRPRHWPRHRAVPGGCDRRRAAGATTGGGAVLGALAGHAAAGMSRKDLKELGEHLDAGQAGLVVVAVSDMGAKVEAAMAKADKVEKQQLEADTAEIQKDAEADG